MSALSDGLRFERSVLPPAHQLDLHFDADEFLTLVETLVKVSRQSLSPANQAGRHQASRHPSGGVIASRDVRSTPVLLWLKRRAG